MDTTLFNSCLRTAESSLWLLISECYHIQSIENDCGRSCTVYLKILPQMSAVGVEENHETSWSEQSVFRYVFEPRTSLIQVNLLRKVR
jgi:hypothetical protein